ncbi:MAG: CRISPR system precrRNA processing endoribonuclease RAMP protein Cas6 [Acidobacteria bacterium]|nr:MAG: CRISPR system precrRNA processing endoribonuclease RAMP protein Cas6 [Acidobacteriota bacterium]
MPRAEPAIEAAQRHLAEASRWRLEARTPTRLKVGGRWADRLRARDLVVAAARRTAGIVRHHGDGTVLGPPVREVIERAERLVPIDESWRWIDLGRYSARQRRFHRLGGIVGQAVYPPWPKEVTPFLLAARFLGLGKGTAFGLGRLEVGSVL